MALTVKITTNDPKRVSMVQRYWVLDHAGKFKYKLNELARQFDLPPSKVTQLVVRYGHAMRSDITCQECGTGYPVKTRSEAALRRQQFPEADGWLCQACQRQQHRLDRAKRRDVIRQAYREALSHQVVLRDLTPRQQLLLFALYRHAAYASWDFIQPVLGRETCFAPTESMETTLLTGLWRSHIISPHAIFSDAAVNLGDDQSLDVDVRHVGWEVTTFLDHTQATLGQEGITSSALYFALQNTVLDAPFRRRHQADIDALALELACEEALRYLAHRLSLSKVTLTKLDAARRLIGAAMATHSLGQLCSLLWTVTRRESRPRPRLCSWHAPLDEVEVLAAIEEAVGMGHHAELELDDLGEGYPLSTLSHLVFHDLLKVEARGFRCPRPVTRVTSFTELGMERLASHRDPSFRMTNSAATLTQAS